MAKIKKGDEVIVIAGKDKDKTGKVLTVKGNKVLVEGVNVVKKHGKPTQENPQGGITEKESLLDISNVMLLQGGKGVRVGFKVEDGKKVRINKKTGEVIA